MNTGIDASKTTTQTRSAYEYLRGEILGGRLLPGHKLAVVALAANCDVSPGAIREALAMLEADALVTSSPQRGFRVSPTSTRDLMHVSQARIEIEKICLAEAIAHGDLAWESRVVASFHHLSRLPMQIEDRPLNPAWIAAHAAFHRSLVAGCTNPWLLKMHQMLYEHTERYRQLAAPLKNQAPRDVATEHQTLLNAVLSKDIPLAQSLITAHLQTTVDLLLNTP
ncbi:GntR family transcriptional regulator, partial [Hydrogenophaga sp.]|uniref:GntR family transcriptional regulator n=1 Tax=Hydrogenophaga sp. TaxID=1904254 RepID=UPI0035688ED2